MGTVVAGLAGASVRAAEAPDTLLTAEERAWVAGHPVVLFAPERDFPPFSFDGIQFRAMANLPRAIVFGD